MKTITIILAASVASFLLSSCKDLSEQPEKMEPVVQSQAPEVYPLNRTITDTSGRSIDAVIHGKQNLQIAISKVSDSKMYIIPLDRLTSENQEFFTNLRDGGNFSSIKKKLDREARLHGRIARWHSNVIDAEREASKLDLPLLLAVMITGNDESKTFEKTLSFSNEFRDWAGTNLVLCLLKIDNPYGPLTTSHTAAEDRKSAARYGITDYESPTMMLIKPDEGVRKILSKFAFADTQGAIRYVDTALHSDIGWRSVLEPENATNGEALSADKNDSSGNLRGN